MHAKDFSVVDRGLCRPDQLWGERIGRTPDVRRPLVEALPMYRLPARAGMTGASARPRAPRRAGGAPLREDTLRLGADGFVVLLLRLQVSFQHTCSKAIVVLYLEDRVQQ
ncbi:MAG TPA: hypothetical protein VHC41_02760, partial [Mycobacteriales bacterium]|nr:hypothetical protein [Mycobacteriales bacterium]